MPLSLYMPLTVDELAARLYNSDKEPDSELTEKLDGVYALYGKMRDCILNNKDVGRRVCPPIEK